MKINLVLPHQLPFPPIRGGGVENLNWMLAREFARQGHEVVAYSRILSELAARETDGHGIRHVRVTGYDRHPNRWVDHVNGLHFARSVFSVLEPADVTSFHTPFSFLLRRKAGIGVCTHTIHRTPKWPVPFYRKLDRVYCGSDAVVTQARRIDPQIRNLKRIYNCVALDCEPLFSFGRGEETGLQFLYVGRFVPDKGIASLVQGFELSLPDFPNNRLLTIGPQTGRQGGNGRFLRSMKRYTAKRGLDRQVTFLPPEFDRVKLDARIAAADVICVPSLSGETFSMAILEAMALGKPVLVSDFSPMPEAVDHLVTGYVARAGNPQSLADGVRFFSQRPSELVEMGSAGFEKAQRCFSVKTIAGEYLDDFEALICDRRAGMGCPRREHAKKKTIVQALTEERSK